MTHRDELFETVRKRNFGLKFGIFELSKLLDSSQTDIAVSGDITLNPQGLCDQLALLQSQLQESEAELKYLSQTCNQVAPEDTKSHRQIEQECDLAFKSLRGLLEGRSNMAGNRVYDGVDDQNESHIFEDRTSAIDMSTPLRLRDREQIISGGNDLHDANKENEDSHLRPSDDGKPDTQEKNPFQESNQNLSASLQSDELLLKVPTTQKDTENEHTEIEHRQQLHDQEETEPQPEQLSEDIHNEVRDEDISGAQFGGRPMGDLDAGEAGSAEQNNEEGNLGEEQNEHGIERLEQAEESIKEPEEVDAHESLNVGKEPQSRDYSYNSSQEDGKSYNAEEYTSFLTPDPIEQNNQTPSYAMPIDHQANGMYDASENESKITALTKMTYLLMQEIARVKQDLANDKSQKILRQESGTRSSLEKEALVRRLYTRRLQEQREHLRLQNHYQAKVINDYRSLTSDMLEYANKEALDMPHAFYDNYEQLLDRRLARPSFKGVAIAVLAVIQIQQRLELRREQDTNLKRDLKILANK